MLAIVTYSILDNGMFAWYYSCKGYNVITVNISVLFVAIKRAVLLQVISKWLDSKGFALFLNCSDNV